ncbi:metal-dependent hydrolase [soil metagenome]
MGEATLGRKVGNKAMLWGAVAATIPDLDVLAYPFLRQVQELYLHRGVTHSLLFGLVVSPLFGYLVYRLYRGRGSPAADPGWRGWSLLFALGVLSHFALDLLTVYGVQILWPFVDTKLSLPTLFIVDPFYTIWFAIALPILIVMRRRGRRQGRDIGDVPRRILLAMALGVSTAYIAWGVGARTVTADRAERALTVAGVTYDRMLVAPAPLSTFAWQVTADLGDGFSVGTLSVFDGPAPIRFHFVPANHQAALPLVETRAIQRLEWFSQGYYIVLPDTISLSPARLARGEELTGVRIADLRFGRNDAWLTNREDAEYYFQWSIISRSGEISDLRQWRPPFFAPGVFSQMVARTFGRRSAEGY